MANLGELKFIEEEKNMVSSLINRFGDDEHPHCDDSSFDYFNIEYVKEIIAKNKEIIGDNLSMFGLIWFNNACEKLNSNYD